MPSYPIRPTPPVQPIEFQKAMIFIDGTNLFYRLEGAKLQLTQKLAEILSGYTNKRQVVRVYLYTIEEHFKKHKAIHGDCISEGIRLVYGEGVPTKDGNFKEKGVDALLVADLVYHAAVKNFDYALVVTTDTDFVQALRRVEDFGCRTGVLGICANLPDRLRGACDEPQILEKQTMLDNGWATVLPGKGTP